MERHLPGERLTELIDRPRNSPERPTKLLGLITELSEDLVAEEDQTEDSEDSSTLTRESTPRTRDSQEGLTTSTEDS